MRLRKQLVFLSLLSLSLPWAGCQYIKEVGSVLEQGQLSALDATARAIAARLNAEPSLLGGKNTTKNLQTLYAHTLTHPLIVDGYIDDWRSLELPAQHFSNSADSNDNFSADIRAAKLDNYLYLFIQVQTASINYHHPGSPELASGDHLVLSRGLAGDRSRDYTLTTSAPGSLIAFYRDSNGRTRQEHAIEGIWHEQPRGYAVELQLPLTFADHGFGLQAAKYKRPSDNNPGTYHSQATPAVLTYQLDRLNQALQTFQQPGLQLEVVNKQGWSLARTGSLDIQASHSPSLEQPSWLTLKLYQLALTDNPEITQAEYATGHLEGEDIDQALAGMSSHLLYKGRRGHIGRSSAVISHNGDTLGVLIAEQSSEQLLTLTGNAFTRLIQYSFITTLLVSFALLAYASWLSWRIRTLGKAATKAVGDDGQLQSLPSKWPSFNASDEIGDLSRNYRELLQRLEEHTSYLKTLASKLSHELRTPLAVVRSSLDNLEHVQQSPEANTYLCRAREGSERLSKLISSMSVASRLERSIQDAEREPFDLAQLLQELTEAYRGIYSQQLLVTIIPGDYRIHGAPELLVQLLDKLSDNASDFCPTDGTIEYRLQQHKDIIHLSVSNDGPPLPETMQEQLFESLVSVRSNTSDTPHMGLGLHIVRLIAAFHHGRASATNRKDESGVIFNIELTALKTDS